MISTKERLSPEEEFNKLVAALHEKVRKPGIADKDIKTRWVFESIFLEKKQEGEEYAQGDNDSIRALAGCA